MPPSGNIFYFYFEAAKLYSLLIFYKNLRKKEKKKTRLSETHYYLVPWYSRKTTKNSKIDTMKH